MCFADHYVVERHGQLERQLENIFSHERASIPKEIFMKFLWHVWQTASIHLSSMRKQIEPEKLWQSKKM